MSTIDKKIKQLPKDMQGEVIDFIDFLLAKKGRKRKRPNLKWIGGLSQFRSQFTSLDLQKKADEWRD